MPWNGWGEGIVSDFTKAPWTAGVMVLSHEEVLHVLEETQTIIDTFVTENGHEPPANEWVVPRYNEMDWRYCINGDTYAVIKGYDPEVNTLGINENGIVKPEVEVVEEHVEEQEEPPIEEVGE